MKACVFCKRPNLGPGDAHPACVEKANRRPGYDTRLAAYGLIVDGGRVLLAHIRDGAWSLPGGGVDKHETPEDGAIREVHEETGHDIHLGRLIGVRTEVLAAADRYGPRSHDLKAVQVIFTAAITGGTLTNEVDESTDEARWFPLADLPPRRLPSIDWALERAGLTIEGASR